MISVQPEAKRRVDFNQIRSGLSVRPSRGGRHGATWLAVVIFLFGIMLAAVATAAPPPPDTVKTQQAAVQPSLFDRLVYYIPNRVGDFIDIWRFNVGAGLGAGINIRPTKGLQFGLAAYDSVRAGLRGRRWPPVWHEWSAEGGLDGMYYEGGETERGFYEFGGTIHFVIIGLDAALDIEEALDFGYGVFLSDPADDDYR